MAAITAATLAKWAIPIGLEMGHSWLQGRDIKKAQKKAEKENRRAQAMSNLINALSPSARHQARLEEAEYRPSGLTRALGAAKLGYGAYTGLKGLIAKEALQKGAQELQDLAIGEAKRGAGKEVGQEYAARAIRQAKAAGIKPGTEDWNRVTGVISRFGGDREGFGAGAMGALQEYEDTGLNRQALVGQIGRTIGADRYARERMAADRAGADLGYEPPASAPLGQLSRQSMITPPEGEGVVRADRDPFGPGEASGFWEAQRVDETARQAAETGALRRTLLQSQIDSLGDPGLPKLDAQAMGYAKTIGEGIARKMIATGVEELDDNEIIDELRGAITNPTNEQLQVGLYQAKRDFWDSKLPDPAQREAFGNTLYKTVAPKLRGNSFISKTGEFLFGFNTLVGGFDQKNGSGDIMMINGFSRLQDPSVVRPSEFATIEEAMSWLDSIGMIPKKTVAGDRLTDDFRNQLYKAGQDLYGQHRKTIDGIIKREEDFVGLIWGDKFKPEVTAFGATYKLPELSRAKKLSREEVEGLLGNLLAIPE